MSFRMFCSACGALLPGAPPVTCPTCRTSHWRDPKPCASALVTQSGRLLMVKRNHEPWIGCWDIPGGFCGTNEHPIATAEREVREEAGLTIRITGFLGMWPDVYDRSVEENVQKPTLNIYFFGVPADGLSTYADPDEVSALGWFPPENLPQQIAFPHHITAVLKAWSQAYLSGQTVTPLLDRPT